MHTYRTDISRKSSSLNHKSRKTVDTVDLVYYDTIVIEAADKENITVFTVQINFIIEDLCIHYMLNIRVLVDSRLLWLLLNHKTNEVYLNY